MTETGILNREIAAEMAKMGHTDMMIITDAGLAVPNSVKVIDLSLKENVPTAVEVLKTVLKNFSVEKYIISQAWMILISGQSFFMIQDITTFIKTLMQKIMEFHKTEKDVS